MRTRSGLRGQAALALAASAGSEGSGWRPFLSQIPPLPGELLRRSRTTFSSGLRNRDTGEPQPHGTVGTRPLHLVHSRHGSAWQTSALRDCHPCPQKGRRALLAEGHQADGEEPSFQTVALGSRLIPTIHQLWHLSEPQSPHLH